MWKRTAREIAKKIMLGTGIHLAAYPSWGWRGGALSLKGVPWVRQAVLVAPQQGLRPGEESGSHWEEERGLQSGGMKIGMNSFAVEKKRQKNGHRRGGKGKALMKLMMSTTVQVGKETCT